MAKKQRLALDRYSIILLHAVHGRQGTNELAYVGSSRHHLPYPARIPLVQVPKALLEAGSFPLVWQQASPGHGLLHLNSMAKRGRPWGSGSGLIIVRRSIIIDRAWFDGSMTRSDVFGENTIRLVLSLETKHILTVVPDAVRCPIRCCLWEGSWSVVLHCVHPSTGTPTSLSRQGRRLR